MPASRIQEVIDKGKVSRDRQIPSLTAHSLGNGPVLPPNSTSGNELDACPDGNPSDSKGGKQKAYGPLNVKVIIQIPQVSMPYLIWFTR